MWVPDLILLVGTRTAIGIGAGLLLARRLNRDQGKAAGVALIALGGFTTVPLAMRFAGRRRWRQHWLARHGGEGCDCGCPHCCPAREETAGTEGSESPAA
ncbi:MAG: hypothetical protein ACRD01_01745 [Terriglobales bacterium]